MNVVVTNMDAMDADALAGRAQILSHSFPRDRQAREERTVALRI